MFHIRKSLTKAEKEQYRRWREKHLSELSPEVRNPTRAQRDASASTFWAKHAEQVKQVMRGTPTCDEVQRCATTDWGPPRMVEGKDFPTEEEMLAWQAREAAAQAEIKLKQTRIAPVFNKGGDQYWTEEMVQDLKSGSNRRRP